MSGSALKISTLDRFHTPHPRPALMRALGWLNDRFVLPRIARVAEIRLPDVDAGRLREALRTPFVICPNHPEFFTDWMLDKWLTNRFAPRAACWADPEVVNGAGRAMHWLALSNNLVAAVRGEEADKALAYSGASLARGDGALIHPEGGVNWDNEALGTLRAGALRIAEHGAERAGRAAHVVPIAWFIRFREDATPGLQRELDYVEQRLRVHAQRLAGPAQRLAVLYASLLEQQAEHFGIDLGAREDAFVVRFHRGLEHALRELDRAWPQYRPAELPPEPEDAARAWRSASRKLDSPEVEFRRQMSVLERILRLVPAGVAEPMLTQEQVGERIKRLRLDWLRGTLRDEVSRFVPRAAARRDVFMRIDEPLAIERASDSHAAVLDALRARLLAALAAARQDGLELLGPPVLYANPFIT